jgi:enterochelin esterase-like enzyme
MTAANLTVTIKTVERFRSKHLHNSRPVTIFLPPDYQADQHTRYKVLYVNDGQEMAALKMKETLEALYAHHEIEPLIVVALHATRDRLQEYGTAGIPNARGLGKRARKYTWFVLDEVLPYINRHYRTLSGPHNTALMGISLGGLMAFDMAWNHPDVFGAVGVMSGSMWWRTDEKDTHAKQESRIMHRRVRDTEAPGHLKLWFEAGSDDERADRDHNGVIDVIQDTAELIDELVLKGYRRGIDMLYVQVEGGEHNYATWACVLPYFLRWTFPTSRYLHRHPINGHGFLSLPTKKPQHSKHKELDAADADSC